MTRSHMGDWLLLMGLTVMWGSAFMLTKIAVSVLPPSLVVAGRLAVAAAVLLGLLLLKGGRLPGTARLWWFLFLIAVVGNVVPFYLISWGQQSIDSGLAGILMAVMPLATLLLAHLLLEGERLTVYRVFGFVLGFSGVVVLTGPSALLTVKGEGGEFVAMLAVLGGALCYGVAAVIARLRPQSRPLESAVGMTSIAAVVMLPMLPLEVGGIPGQLGVWRALVAVVVLGVVSTALPAIVYFRLIESAGPNFVAFLNYLIPLWAVLLGMVFLDEEPALTDLSALLLIMSGIAVAHSDRRRRRL